MSTDGGIGVRTLQKGFDLTTSWNRKVRAFQVRGLPKEVLELLESFVRIPDGIISVEKA